MKIKISEWNLATKLVAVNLSAILVLGAILSLVFFSFKNIETLVSGSVKKEVPQVIDNSHIGNELAGMFADLLMSMFYEEEETVKRKSDRFEQTISTIAALDVNPRLQTSLEEFRPKLAVILDQFSLIREISKKFKITEGDFIYDLETLQDSISEQIEILDEDSPAMRHMEQLKSTGTRYREVFLDITLQVAELRGGKTQVTMPEEHPVIADLNYLNLSLETLLAADSEIREQGIKLMKIIQNYKETLIQFLNVVAKFQKQLSTVSDSKDHVYDHSERYQ